MHLLRVMGQQELGGLMPELPVGLLAFVVVCRLLIMSDCLGRHWQVGGRCGLQGREERPGAP